MGVIQEAIRKSQTEKSIYDLAKMIREHRARYQVDSELERTTIPVAELEAMLGTEVAMQLTYKYAGRRLPSPWHLLLKLRQQAVRADYRRGFSVRHLRQKYQLSAQRVNELIADLRPERKLPRDPRDVDRLT